MRLSQKVHERTMQIHQVHQVHVRRTRTNGGKSVNTTIYRTVLSTLLIYKKLFAHVSLEELISCAIKKCIEIAEWNSYSPLQIDVVYLRFSLLSEICLIILPHSCCNIVTDLIHSRTRCEAIL